MASMLPLAPIEGGTRFVVAQKMLAKNNTLEASKLNEVANHIYNFFLFTIHEFLFISFSYCFGRFRLPLLVLCLCSAVSTHAQMMKRKGTNFM